MKKLFAFFLGSMFLISCSLTQHFHFNNDYSGNYKMDFDMSALMDMAGEMDSTDSEEDVWADVPMDSLEDVLNQLDGISNARVFVEENVLKFSYDFEDLESLNSAMHNTDMDEGEDEYIGALMGEESSFEAKGKKFYYTTPDMAGLEVADSIADYMEMFEYGITMSFEKNIKKIDNEHAVISSDNKSLTMSGNFKELLKGEKTLSTEVRLK